MLKVTAYCFILKRLCFYMNYFISLPFLNFLRRNLIFLLSVSVPFWLMILKKGLKNLLIFSALYNWLPIIPLINQNVTDDYGKMQIRRSYKQKILQKVKLPKTGKSVVSETASLYIMVFTLCLCSYCHKTKSINYYSTKLEARNKF